VTAVGISLVGEALVLEDIHLPADLAKLDTESVHNVLVVHSVRGVCLVTLFEEQEDGFTMLLAHKAPPV
jgi:hypothetical protein